MGSNPAKRAIFVSKTKPWGAHTPLNALHPEASPRLAVQVLCHAGAMARLRETGNPKALRDQLRHVDARMTIRYLKTLSAAESLRINQGVDFRR